MSRRIAVVMGLLTAALVVTTVGWIRSSDSVRLGEDKPARFDSCTFDGSLLVLRWTYGVSELVAPSVDTRPRGKVVVELVEKTQDEPTISIGLLGEAEFTIYGGDEGTTFEYADGKRLECARPPRHQLTNLRPPRP
ncbi:hypothetical protein F0U44_04720 [Nocardioides humilatus]|uniref:Uncharacterized protein n=1 Tax=Nocardioides humilatus TaxID=2607660 RepID=A0A5B1LPU7_9ACTN|nr:hypothetical protein [Nocardioides humilatus]KAA1421587.1 hypothetical protein F0U44_04720 [Nocardioides humilatus]